MDQVNARLKPQHTTRYAQPTISNEVPAIQLVKHDREMDFMGAALSTRSTDPKIHLNRQSFPLDPSLIAAVALLEAVAH